MNYDLDNLFDILKEDKQDEELQENLNTDRGYHSNNEECDSCNSKNLITDNG